MKRIIVSVGLVVFAAGVARASLIVNGGFESPPGAVGEPAPTDWNFFSSGPNTSGVVPSGFAQEGLQLLQFFGSPLDAGSFQGYAQDKNIGLNAGQKVNFYSFVRSSPFLQYTNAMTLELKIEFFNNNVFLNSAQLDVTKDDITTGAWTQFLVSGAPVSSADMVRFVIAQNVGFTPNESGIIWVDNVAAYVVPEPSLLGLLVFGGLVARFAHRHRQKRRPHVPS